MATKKPAKKPAAKSSKATKSAKEEVKETKAPAKPVAKKVKKVEKPLAPSSKHRKHITSDIPEVIETPPWEETPNTTTSSNTLVEELKEKKVIKPQKTGLTYQELIRKQNQPTRPVTPDNASYQDIVNAASQVNIQPDDFVKKHFKK